MSEPEISPLARRLAEENNVEWRGLRGSGGGGKVVERDVLEYLARVMAGDEDLNPTPEPLPEGVDAWPEDDLAGFQRGLKGSGDESELEQIQRELSASERGPYPSPEADLTAAATAEADADAELDGISEDIFLFDDDVEEHESDASHFGAASRAPIDDLDDGLLIAGEDEGQEEAASDQDEASLWSQASAASQPDTLPDVFAEASATTVEVEEEATLDLFEEPVDDAVAAAAPELDIPAGDALDMGASDVGQQGSAEAGGDDDAGTAVGEPDAVEGEGGFDVAAEDAASHVRTGRDLGEPIAMQAGDEAEPAPAERDLYGPADDADIELELPEEAATVAAAEASTVPSTEASMDASTETAAEASTVVVEDAPEDAADDAAEDAAEAEALVAEGAETVSDAVDVRPLDVGSEGPGSDVIDAATVSTAAASTAAEPPRAVERSAAGSTLPPAMPAELPFVRYGSMLRRHLDLTALARAQVAVGQELGDEHPLAPTAFLVRAAAKAMAAGRMAARSEASRIVLATFRNGTLRYADVDASAADGFRGLLRAVASDDDLGAVTEGAALVVADMSELEVDEAVLNVGAPVLTLGRVLYDNQSGSYRSTLSLSGDMPPEHGTRLLAKVAELLDAPIRLVL